MRAYQLPWVFALWLIPMVPSAAFAHAVPVTASPAPNSTLSQAPWRVTIRFSERVEGRASSLRVFDAPGHRVDDGDAAVAAGDPWLYGVALRPMDGGAYTVSWRVMSADDGHITEGAYVFLVGETAGSAHPTMGHGLAEPGWLAPLGRWVGTLGVAGLLGMLSTPLVFWRRRPFQAPAPVVVLPCLGAIVVGTGVVLLAKALQIAGEYGLWTALMTLMQTTAGQVWAAKIGLALLLSGVWAAYWRALGRRHWWWFGVIAVALVILMIDIMVSHSAAVVEFRILAIGAQMAHLLGMALWLGGLGYFATLFWRSAWCEPTVVRELAWAVPTFSLLAAGAVGLLTLSGIYLARLHLGTLDGLISTPYGRILLAKLALVALMGAFGGYHHVVVHRRLLRSVDHADEGGDRLCRRCRLTLQLEALLGVMVLFVAALLGTTAPSPAVRVAEAEPFRQEREVGDVRLTLEISPARPGPNTIRLRVHDRHGQPSAEATSALLQLTPTDVGVGSLALALDRESSGLFVKTGALLGVEGHWRGRLVIQRAGAFDLHDRVDFVLPSEADPHTHDGAAAPVDGAMGLVALGVIGATVFLLTTSHRKLRRGLRLLACPRPAAANQSERR